MSLRLITAPANYPVTLGELKLALRIDSSANDAHLTKLIKTVTEAVDGRDGRLGRAILEQTWDLYLDAFPSGAIEIPLPPLRSVTSVNYLPESGAEIAIDPANYTVDMFSDPGWIVPIFGFSWPAPLQAINAVRIRFIAGFDADKVPSVITDWIIREIGKRHENRDEDISFDFDTVDAQKVNFFF